MQDIERGDVWASELEFLLQKRRLRRSKQSAVVLHLQEHLLGLIVPLPQILTKWPELLIDQLLLIEFRNPGITLQTDHVQSCIIYNLT